MTEPVIVRRLDAREARERTGALSAVLIDCVEGGASVGFMAPLTRERTDGFWRNVADGVAAGARLLLVAEEAGSREIVGTVQLAFAPQENQPHRVDVAKMLVRRSARGRGVGSGLLRAAEDAARAAGKTLLVLDTVPGSDADRLYRRLGWTAVGVVPGYALMPDGAPCDTTIFYKILAKPAERPVDPPTGA